MKKKVMTGHSVTKIEVEDLLKEYRSDMFTRFDEVVGKLDQIREDHLFMNHDIHELKETDADHEKRLKKLENRTKN